MSQIFEYIVGEPLEVSCFPCCGVCQFWKEEGIEHESDWGVCERTTDLKMTRVSDYCKYGTFS